jgi:hypothetical protein
VQKLADKTIAALGRSSNRAGQLSAEIEIYAYLSRFFAKITIINQADKRIPKNAALYASKSVRVSPPNRSESHLYIGETLTDLEALKAVFFKQGRF